MSFRKSMKIPQFIPVPRKTNESICFAWQSWWCEILWNGVDWAVICITAVRLVAFSAMLICANWEPFALRSPWDSLTFWKHLVSMSLRIFVFSVFSTKRRMRITLHQYFQDHFTMLINWVVVRQKKVFGMTWQFKKKQLREIFSYCDLDVDILRRCLLYVLYTL